jgi:hypothetical protein
MTRLLSPKLRAREREGAGAAVEVAVDELAAAYESFLRNMAQEKGRRLTLRKTTKDRLRENVRGRLLAATD